MEKLQGTPYVGGELVSELGLRAGRVCNLTASRAPTATDDSTLGYAVGSWWFDTIAKRAWLCIDETAAAASWISVGGYVDAHKTGDGGTTDYTEFDETGHQSMAGDARPWRDEYGDAVTLKVQGVGVAPDVAEATMVYATNADLNDYLYTNRQLNHDRDETSKIYPHIHWLQAENKVPNFLLQYRWQVNGAAKATAWQNLKCQTLAFAYTSGTIHQIVGTASGITPPQGSTVSDIVQFRILRDNANASGAFAGADGYSAAVHVLSFDVHIQLNSLGSTNQYQK